MSIIEKEILGILKIMGVPANWEFPGYIGVDDLCFGNDDGPWHFNTIKGAPGFCPDTIPTRLPAGSSAPSVAMWIDAVVTANRKYMSDTTNYVDIMEKLSVQRQIRIKEQEAQDKITEKNLIARLEKALGSLLVALRQLEDSKRGAAHLDTRLDVDIPGEKYPHGRMSRGVGFRQGDHKYEIWIDDLRNLDVIVLRYRYSAGSWRDLVRGDVDAVLPVMLEELAKFI